MAVPADYNSEIEKQRLSKLVLGGGVINLPDPDTLKCGWEDSPAIPISYRVV